MPDRTMLDITRDVLTEVAPGELADLEQNIRAVSAQRKLLRARSER